MKTLIDSFDRQFRAVHDRSVLLTAHVPAGRLFWKPRDLGRTMAMFSCGEYILRSAAAVEQCFGGITTKLWDDPFEWTLPEKLSTPALVLEYLAEVEETRRKGFAYFTGDGDLAREMPAPDRLRPIHEILLDTVARAENFQGRAFSIFRMFSDEKLPGF
jgi:hypothetical protein